MLKRILPIFILLSFVFTQCSGSTTEPTEIRELNEIEKKVVSSSDEFGFNLLKKVNEFEGEKNIFISPLSVSMALGMAINGASGTTYDAMQSMLQFNSLTKDEINNAYKSLIELLTQVDQKVKFQIANSIWYKNNMQFEKEFIDINKKYFDAEIAGLNFEDPVSVSKINSWVNVNTNGNIEKIIEMIPEDAIMYLINAIYFKSPWKYEFDKTNTREDLFNLANGDKVNCQMMAQQNEKFSYYSNANFQAIDLPYGDGDLSMTIILPNYDKTTNEIIDQLNTENWNSWLSNFSEQSGILQLPKFKLEKEYKLNDILAALGMEIAFSYHADFTNIYKYGGVFISEVRHKTFVDVNEEGTEAAAVTSVELSYKSVNVDGFIMRVDRPFIFVIREKNSGSFLFIGKIINPN